MNRLSRLAPGCVVIAMIAGLVLAKAQQSKEAAGDRPVTAEQVVEKLKADGWSEIVISRNGRYLEVSGLVNGQAGKLAVDSQTGRLKADADDDDDDDD
jgi:predicted aspartyl protease